MLLTLDNALASRLFSRLDRGGRAWTSGQPLSRSLCPVFSLW